MSYLNNSLSRVLCVVFCLLLGCTTVDSPVTQTTDSKDDTTGDPFLVDFMVLEKQSFPRELISNGQLQSKHRSRMPFRMSGYLGAVYVNDGVVVEAGQTLAALCTENIERQLRRAQYHFDRSALDMEDILLGQGYRMKDSVNIPPATWHMAAIRSGYLESLMEITNLESDLEKANIIAPFSGTVIGVEKNMNEHVVEGEVFCTIINNDAFLVTFFVMENEIEYVNQGGRVEVLPFAQGGHTHKGEIYSIHPVVDDNGQVKLKAVVRGHETLMEGMHVRVKVYRNIPGQLVVPKAALLVRDNRNVLFRYSRGEAVWTYVKVLYENSTHYSVIADPRRASGLAPGDTVIFSENVNLAHGSRVNPR